MLHLILYGPFWLGLEPYDYVCMCFASIVQFMKTRSLVCARDDVSRALCSFSWVLTWFRQKNIRTKEYIEKQTHVQASLTFVCLFYVLHLRMLIAQLFFWWKEQMCNILQLVSSSSFLAGTRNLLMVVCMCPRQHCSIHWDEIPGPGQEWRVAGTVLFPVGTYALRKRT